ncbi:hypothetical protein JVU11DRAFT_8169 [Chiua virens]|nr:hypothetical protein JVU11DRAFT_8169 [Chiua virens]
MQAAQARIFDFMTPCQSEEKIAGLEDTVQQLRSELAASRDKTDTFTQILQLEARERKDQCEILYAQGRIDDALQLLSETSGCTSNSGDANNLIVNIITDFAHRYITTLEGKGNEAAITNNHDDALAAYTAALSLSPSTLTKLLSKWANIVLLHGSVDKSVVDTATLKLQNFDVHQEATKCFRQIQRNSPGDVSNYGNLAQWELRGWFSDFPCVDFLQRCGDQLEKLGDTAIDSQRYTEAAGHFSTILSFNPVNRVEILVKRSKARVSAGSWKNALCDADEIIKLDPSSHRGYEQRHAALHAGRQYTKALDGFREMLAKLKESSDERNRKLGRQYIDVTPVIQEAIDKTVSNMPGVLIDTTTGRLYDKVQQKVAFQKHPIYDELRSSMTTRLSLDRIRILREVEQFYRYVMLSHRWEEVEPLYQTVQNISIYELESSSPNTKLQEFCRVGGALGFHWVWSDTCCIDKKDIVVLHESLVAMFRWYRGSALTLVHLRGVQSKFQKRGDLGGSEWSKRGWTYQEYVAAETVQFYTEDWKPYLGLDMFNHKKSPIVVAEMEQASHVSAEKLNALQPGPNRVREKLFLASQRLTTVAEDAAYSLLGIFDADIFIKYGEGKCKAIGRLLEYALTSSSDVTILAWSGPAGDYNSSLPADLTVYDQLVPPQIPHAIEPAKLDNVVHTLRSSLSDSDLALVVRLYYRLNELPLPSINAGRLELHGIMFSVTKVVESDSGMDCRVYRATTSSLGEVEIKTKDTLSDTEDLFLIHPWICVFLDQGFSWRRGAAGQLDDTTRALYILACLRQPFGALLLARVERVRYRRVATDSLIMTRIREDTSVNALMAGITKVDVK